MRGVREGFERGSRGVREGFERGVKAERGSRGVREWFERGVRLERDVPMKHRREIGPLFVVTSPVTHNPRPALPRYDTLYAYIHAILMSNASNLKLL